MSDTRTESETPVPQELHPNAELADLRRLADETAADAQTYLETLTEVASGSQPDAALPLLMLAVSQALASGTRLGAITDVVPSERFEPDSGPDPDVDRLRAGLVNVFEGFDDYLDVHDPVVARTVEHGSVSNDLIEIADSLVHGLRHYRAGRLDEALWWWQYSYLSTWGVRAATVLRVLQWMVSHIRLDIDADTAGEAQFEALHADDGAPRG